MKGPHYKIDFDALSLFIRKNGEIAYEDDILAILRRYDSDEDAKLSYIEFVNAILPNDINKRTSVNRSSKKLRPSPNSQLGSPA